MPQSLHYADKSRYFSDFTLIVKTHQINNLLNRFYSVIDKTWLCLHVYASIPPLRMIPNAPVQIVTLETLIILIHTH